MICKENMFCKKVSREQTKISIIMSSLLEEKKLFVEQPLQKTKEIIESLRTTLKNRLEKLTNKYHNKQHAEDVATNLQTLLANLENTNLFSDKIKLLLVECALRHDDGHSGNTFRQDVFSDDDLISDDLSNEEYAVILLEEDFRGKLNIEDINFMVAHILATSFGQNDISKFPKNKEHYYRSYEPKTDSQKLLALADVMGFNKGWDKWVEDSFCLYEESKQSVPDNVDEWIKRQKNFVNNYIQPLLKSVENLLKQEYITQLKRELDIISQRLLELEENLANPERVEYKARLKSIKES